MFSSDKKEILIALKKQADFFEVDLKKIEDNFKAIEQQFKEIETQINHIYTEIDTLKHRG